MAMPALSAAASPAPSPRSGCVRFRRSDEYACPLLQPRRRFLRLPHRLLLPPHRQLLRLNRHRQRLPQRGTARC